MTRRRAAAYTFFGTGTNTLLVSVQAVILIPLYLSAVGPTLYGAWLATGDVLIWLQAFDLGLPNLLTQRVGSAHARADRHRIRQDFLTTVLVLAAVSITFGACAFMAAPTIAGAVGVPVPDRRVFVDCLRVAAIATALLLVNNAVVGFARGVQDVALISAAAVSGTVAGLITSVAGILAGLGLWAIALGIAARVAVVIAMSTYFVVTRAAYLLRGPLWPGATTLREFAALTPATALGGISYSLASQSENFLVALLLRPEAVPLFNLTKKAADMARALLDTVGHASYGGFAHLVASPERPRAAQVFREVSAIRLCLGVAAASAFVVVNASMVAVWVGEEFFGGLLLTTLIALHMIISGQSYLVNSLLRATGRVASGSFALVGENGIRLVLTVVGISYFGLTGAPLAAIATSLPALILYDRWILRGLGAVHMPVRSVARIMVYIALPIAGAALFASHLYVPSWYYVITAGTLWCTAVAIGLLMIDPRLVRVREHAFRLIDSARTAARHRWTPRQ